ncbi:MAG: glycosyltransferase family 2 protein [Desulfovibrio aminophilus]|uniref:glycosyltransferase family 2 protein n=1 Tax=Desulfovibrio aminophilus TaxID=81425 RepID=UPI002A478934|nr:glycosyltransferase family 2 protein [Desulfovibrionaceae bacterium]
MRPLRVLVGVFVYNEGEKFRALLDDPAWAALPDCDLLVVDDGSSDGAAALCAERGVEVIRNERNMGVGYSIRRFLDHARETGHEAVVIMAGNGKMMPSDIPAFLEKLSSGCDYVQGSRFLQGFRSPNLPFGRLLAIRLGTAFFNFFLANRYTDLSCGFRAYRLAPIYEDERIDIRQEWLDRYELEYYIHFKFDRLGYRTAEAPCTMRYPASGKNYTKIKPFVGWWSMLRPWFYLILGLRK